MMLQNNTRTRRWPAKRDIYGSRIASLLLVGKETLHLLAHKLIWVVLWPDMCHSLKCILLLVLYCGVVYRNVLCFCSTVIYLLYFSLPLFYANFSTAPTTTTTTTLPDEMNGHHRTIITLAMFIAGWEQARTLTRLDQQLLYSLLGVLRPSCPTNICPRKFPFIVNNNNARTLLTIKKSETVL